jgi:hypothetical protein
MTFICEICKKYENSHSFKKMNEDEEKILYYTNPNEAKNNNTEGIIYHINGELSQLKNKKWVWVLNLKDFGLRNLFEINNFMEITKLITEKYSSNLVKIIVLTNYYTELIFNFFKNVLSSKIISIIELLNEPNINVNLTEKVLEIIKVK